MAGSIGAAGLVYTSYVSSQGYSSTYASHTWGSNYYGNFDDSSSSSNSSNTTVTGTGATGTATQTSSWSSSYSDSYTPPGGPTMSYGYSSSGGNTYSWTTTLPGAYYLGTKDAHTGRLKGRRRTGRWDVGSSSGHALVNATACA
jgi:hypothetical protein